MHSRPPRQSKMHAKNTRHRGGSTITNYRGLTICALRRPKRCAAPLWRECGSRGRRALKCWLARNSLCQRAVVRSALEKACSVLHGLVTRMSSSGASETRAAWYMLRLKWGCSGRKCEPSKRAQRSPKFIFECDLRMSRLMFKNAFTCSDFQFL